MTHIGGATLPQNPATLWLDLLTWGRAHYGRFWAVSARALNVDGSCFMGFFHHHGTKPQGIRASSTLPSRMATTSTVSVGAML